MKAVTIILCCMAGVVSGQEAYKSPYSVKYTFSPKDLIGDLEGSRGEAKNQSSVKLQSWYSAETKSRYGVWGPPSQHFDPPAGLIEQTPVEDVLPLDEPGESAPASASAPNGRLDPEAI